MKRLTLTAALFALSASVHAVDGVVLIDQAKALAGNVTPGDAPGFPVTISKPGSYKLSGNLTMPNDNTSAIQAAVGSVTLDLNGFVINGVNYCPEYIANEGSQVQEGLCNNGSSSVGVTLLDGSVVRNGKITGFGEAAVTMQSGSVAESLRLEWAKVGIRAYGSTDIRNNIVTQMKVGIVSIHINKLVFGVPSSVGTFGATIRDNTITSTDGTFAVAGNQGRVIGNTIHGNGGLDCSQGVFWYQNNLISMLPNGVAIVGSCINGGGNQM